MSLRSITNVDQYALTREARFNAAAVVTDTFISLPGNPDVPSMQAPAKFAALTAAIAARPRRWHGTYISAAYTRHKAFVADRYPIQHIPSAKIGTRRFVPAGDWADGRQCPDLTDLQTQHDFGVALVDELDRRAVLTGLTDVLFDNVIHPMSGAAPPWRTTCSFRRAIRHRLRLTQPNFRIMWNIACALSEFSAADLALTLASCDGVLLEGLNFWHPNVRDPAGTWRTLRNLRTLLDAGQFVVLVPDFSSSDEALRLANARLWTALALQVYEPGDELTIGWPFTYETTPDILLADYTPLGWTQESGVAGSVKGFDRYFALPTGERLTVSAAFDGASTFNLATATPEPVEGP
jgi:hypothetical protein